MAVISGDSVLLHAGLGATGLPSSTTVLDPVRAAFGVINIRPFGENIVLYGKDAPALLELKPGSREAPSTSATTTATFSFSTFMAEHLRLQANRPTKRTA